MNKDIMDYSLDLKERYTDILLLLNTKERLNSFFTYMVEFLIKEDDKEKLNRGDDYFPMAINIKGNLGVDYNVFVKILAYWSRDILDFKQWELIIKFFSFGVENDITKAKNASIFLVTSVFGQVHRSTSTGFSLKYGVVSYSLLFCVQMVYKNVKNDDRVQYNMVTFFGKKIDKSLQSEDMKNVFKERFENDNFKQIAYGVKKCTEEWGADNRKYFSS